MAHAIFGENTIYFKDSLAYRLIGRFNSVWQTQNLQTNELSTIKQEELLKGYMDQDILFPKSTDVSTDPKSEIKNSFTFGDLSLEQQNQLKLRKWFIDEHIKRNGLTSSVKNIQDSLAKLWDENELGTKPHYTTVIQWYKAYIASDKNILSFLANHQNKGNRSTRIDPLVHDICQAVIDDVLLKKTRTFINKAYENAKFRISEENKLLPANKALSIPSLKFFTRLFKSRSAYEIHASQHGRESARVKFRNAIHSIKAQCPLHIVEIDSTPLDVILVAENGVVLGTPWLTAVIDVYTRSVLGFHLSFDPPSQITLAKALLHAILPKTNLAAEHPGLVGSYAMYGIPSMVFVDNAREYHGNHFDALCLELGITVTYTPRKTPWYKGHVESFLKTCNFDITSRAVGKKFNSIEARGNNNPLKEARITLANFYRALMMWIVDYYHQRIHSTTGMTPNELWVKATKEMYLPLPTDIERAHFLTLEMAERDLWVYGIEINNMRYNNDELGDLSKRYGHNLKVQIRWDKYDLGYIYVVTPDKTYIKVNANDAFIDYARGLSLFQHQIHKRYLAQNNMNLNANNLAYVSEKIFLEMHKKDRKLSKKEQLYKDAHPKSRQETEVGPVKPAIPTTKNVYAEDHVPDFDSAVF